MLCLLLKEDKRVRQRVTSRLRFSVALFLHEEKEKVTERDIKIKIKNQSEFCCSYFKATRL